MVYVEHNEYLARRLKELQSENLDIVKLYVRKLLTALIYPEELDENDEEQKKRIEDLLCTIDLTPSKDIIDKLKNERDYMTNSLNEAKDEEEANKNREINEKESKEKLNNDDDDRDNNSIFNNNFFERLAQDPLFSYYTLRLMLKERYPSFCASSSNDKDPSFLSFLLQSFSTNNRTSSNKDSSNIDSSSKDSSNRDNEKGLSLLLLLLQNSSTNRRGSYGSGPTVSSIESRSKGILSRNRTSTNITSSNKDLTNRGFERKRMRGWTTSKPKSLPSHPPSDIDRSRIPNERKQLISDIDIDI